MTGGVGRFNQAASLAYKALDEGDKERLLSISNTIETTRLMTSTEVKKAGAKTFRNIQQQVKVYVTYLTMCMKYSSGQKK